MNRSNLLQWLREADPTRLQELWRRADETRRLHVGDEVHLRALIEFSNICIRRCHYCGLRADNRKIQRYRMTAPEILAAARQAADLGYGTVVLQSGEDPGTKTAWVTDLIRQIRSETNLALTLSLGERAFHELREWKIAGADRYLLRFETSNPALFERIHPALPGRVSNRLAILRELRELGYEVGSGIMIGIPGQTCDDLARDLELFRELDLDMIGVGPWLPHPDTPLGQMQPAPSEPEAQTRAPDQVPNTELMTYKVLALTRLLCPLTNIPSTTALATLNRAAGRELGLARGANVIMPNLTPPEYRCNYEIYPDKACLYESPADCHHGILGRIQAAGRSVGRGPGASRNWQRRLAAASDNASTIEKK